MSRSPQRGAALIVVLWAVALLTVIGASFAFGVRTETQLAINLVDAARAGALADGGVERGIAALLGPKDDSAWRPDGTIYRFRIDDARVFVAIVSEGGKVDLNAAGQELLRGLVETTDPEADAEAIADAIVDWRDTDSLVRANGAEDRDYRAAGRDTGAGDTGFSAVSQLVQVLGMTPELYEKLAPSLTVDSGRATVDPLSASRETLLAVPNVTEELVDDFLAQREDAGGRRPAVTLGAVGGSAQTLAAAEVPVYTVSALAVLPGGAQAERRAVVRVTNNTRMPYQTLARGQPDPGYFAEVPPEEDTEHESTDERER